MLKSVVIVHVKLVLIAFLGNLGKMSGIQNYFLNTVLFVCLLGAFSLDPLRLPQEVPEIFLLIFGTGLPLTPS